VRARTAFSAAGFAAFAVLAMVEPLACYSLALALFGLPHILGELRYVDRRFGRRLEPRVLVPILVALAGVVTIRAGTVLHLWPSEFGVAAELAGVVVLALAAARETASSRIVGLLVAAGLGAATLVSPIGTSVCLSILHNLTPLGFLWQLAPRGRRAAMMAGALLPLLALPLLVATGLPREALAALGWIGTEADPLGAGGLLNNLFVYVPPALDGSAHAIDLFSASVVAQGGHYLAVIVILPALLQRLDPEATGLVPWPGTRMFAALLCLAGAIGVAAFFANFGEARALYGLAASLHAWIEVPILILALTGAGQPVNASPTSSEAELAASDVSMA
jgi:hypothetical protein